MNNTGITKTFGLILTDGAEYAAIGLALASITPTDRIVLQPRDGGLNGKPYLLFQCEESDARRILNALYETASFAPDVETADAAFNMWERLGKAFSV